MKSTVVQGRSLKLFIVLFSVVYSYTPLHAQKKNWSSENKGFGKKNSRDTGRKKNNAEDVSEAATATTTKTEGWERKYLEPFALELTGNNGNDDDEDDDDVGERSVRTVTDRSEGDALLEIPLEDTITVKSIRSRLASCTLLLDDEEEALALGLLRLKHEASDPYVANVLPKKHYNAWTLPADLWKETSKILPRCYSETFDATRQRVNKFATLIAEKSSSNAEAGDGTAFALDDALWAFSMVRSRSVAVPELSDDENDDDSSEQKMPLALIPGLDLFNHAFRSGTQLELVGVDDDNNNNNKNAKWVVTSADPFEAGDEVFLSYGDDKDNWKLLLTYGFALDKNPNKVVFWSWKDLLDAAHAVRPETFSDPVCKQLMRHPQLEAYTSLSEHRATFSYDAQTNTPRESLSNGLVMLNSLAAQLGKPESDGGALGNEVLGELKRRRLEELRDGQTRLNDTVQNSDSEWNPFFESLRIALQSEEEDLQ